MTGVLGGAAAMVVVSLLVAQPVRDAATSPSGPPEMDERTSGPQPSGLPRLRSESAPADPIRPIAE